VQTILVIDDELGAIEVLVAALEDDGYRVLSAGNGRHGLESLAATAVDLVIVDFMMPLLDGASMGREMKAQPALSAIPIIMMSAVSEALVRKQFAEYTAFLRKPFRVSALLELVHKVLDDPGGAVASPSGTPPSASSPPSTSPPAGSDPSP
jgi:CheY-like chemotaxis protein